MLVGFSGKRGAGKTISANYLVKYYGFKKFSFSDLLKEQSARIFEFTEEHLVGKDKEKPFFKSGETPRDFMIRYGNFIRYFDEEYWIKETLKRATKLPRVVIDDVRYVNEVHAIKRLDPANLIVRIERYKHLNIYRTEINDPSETQLDTYTFDKLINEVENLNLKTLHDRIDMIMDDLGYKAK